MSDSKKPYSFIWYDLYGSFFDWENGFPRTTWELFIRPGKVCWDYINGEKHLVNPFRMFVVYGALSVFVFSIINLEKLQKQYLDSQFSELVEGFKSGVMEDQKESSDPEKENKLTSEEYFKGLQKGYEKFNHWIVRYSALIGLLFSIPVLSILSKILFRKKKLPFAVHFSMNTYFQVISTILYVLFLVPILSASPTTEGYLMASVLSMVVPAIYSVWLYRDFFGSSWLGSFFRAMIIQGVFFFSYFLLAQIVTLLILPILVVTGILN